MISGKYDVRKNVTAVTNMDFLKTDIGRARAWIRLCIEQRVLNLELELLLSARGMMDSFFKDYSFLLQEECRAQLLSHLLSLTTVELLAFSPQYPALERVPYKLIVRTAGGSRSGTSGMVNVQIHGTLAKSDRLTARGAGFGPGAEHEFHFTCKNMGAVRCVELSHDGHGAAASWLVEEVQLDNLLTQTELIILGDGQVDRGKVVTMYATAESAEVVAAVGPTEAKRDPQPSAMASLPPEIFEMQDALCQDVAASVNCIIRAFERETAPSLSLRAQLLLGQIRFNSTDFTSSTGVDAISDGGLCRALLRVMGSGLKKRHPWDFITQASAPEQPKKAFRSPGRRKSTVAVTSSPSRRQSDVLGSPRRRGSTSASAPEPLARRGSEMFGVSRRGSEFSITTSSAPRQLSSDPDNLLLRSVERADTAKVSKAVRFEFLIVSGAHHHLLHVWFDMFAKAAANSKMYVLVESKRLLCRFRARGVSLIFLVGSLVPCPCDTGMKQPPSCGLRSVFGS
jgi:hypothetical protein